MNKFSVFFKNNDSIQLTEQDIVNSGGEGVIYIKDSFAYKIFIDPKKSLNEQKIKELSVLDKDNIIRPIQAVYNEKKEAIGYQMKALDPSKCFSLTRFFTNDFRNQHNIDNDTVIHLIKEMFNTFEFIQNQNCLIVDGNEMNYLISNDFKTVYFIDVDSYQTPSFPATAYNPNTLDPLIKNNQFSSESDWYIFGVLFCQIVLGIHPFKGKYIGTSHTFNKKDITTRMKKGISIFHPKVKLNKAVRSLNLISENMTTWLTDLFTNQARSKPPLLTTVLNQLHKEVSLFNMPEGFKVFEEFSFENSINELFSFNKNLFYTNDNFFYDNNNKIISKKSNLIFSINGKTSFAKLDKDDVIVFIPELKLKQTILSGVEQIYVFNEQLFVKTHNKINLVDVLITNNKLIAGIKTSWPLFHYKDFNNFILFFEGGVEKAYYFYEQNKNAIIDLNTMLKKDEKLINIEGFSSYIVIKSIYKNEYYTKIFYIDLFNKNTKLIFEEETELLDINFIFNNKILIGQSCNDELIMGYFKDSFKMKKISNYSLNKKLYFFNEKIYFHHDKKIYNLSMN